MLDRSLSCLLRVTVVLIGLQIAGCAKPTVNIPAGAPVSGYDDAAKGISDDPVAFLRHSLEEATKLKAFTTNLSRQERLGFFPALRPQEDIRAEFRAEPFSVRFTWDNPRNEFQEALYVKDQYDDKVQLVKRGRAKGSAPELVAYPPSFAVLFQRSRNPITDFGPRRMMERLIERIEKARKIGEVKITLLPPVEIGPAKEPCIHLELRFPKGDPYPCKLLDVYVHAKTQIPVATYLWLPGRVERCADTLDAMYIYGSVNPNVQFTDATFRLSTLDKQAAASGEKATTIGHTNGRATSP